MVGERSMCESQRQTRFSLFITNTPPTATTFIWFHGEYFRLCCPERSTVKLLSHVTELQAAIINLAVLYHSLTTGVGETTPASGSP